MSQNIDSLISYSGSSGMRRSELARRLKLFLCIDDYWMIEEQLTTIVVKAIKDDDEVQVQKLFVLLEHYSKAIVFKVPHHRMVIPHGKDHHIEKCMMIDAELGYCRSNFVLTYIDAAYHVSVELARRVIPLAYRHIVPMDIITTYLNSISFKPELGYLLVQCAGKLLLPLHMFEETILLTGSEFELKRRIRQIGILWIRHTVDNYTSLPIQLRNKNILRDDIMKFYMTNKTDDDSVYIRHITGFIRNYTKLPIDGWEVYLDIADIEGIEYMSIITKLGDNDLIKKCLSRDSIDYIESLRACIAEGSEMKLILSMKEIGIPFDDVLGCVTNDGSSITLQMIELLRDEYKSDVQGDYLVDFLHESQ